jgi:hypothetical protein
VHEIPGGDGRAGSLPRAGARPGRTRHVDRHRFARSFPVNCRLPEAAPQAGRDRTRVVRGEPTFSRDKRRARSHRRTISASKVSKTPRSRDPYGERVRISPTASAGDRAGDRAGDSGGWGGVPVERCSRVRIAAFDEGAHRAAADAAREVQERRPPIHRIIEASCTAIRFPR